MTVPEAGASPRLHPRTARTFSGFRSRRWGGIPRCSSTLPLRGATLEGANVPDNVQLTVRLHSVSGEDISVITRDFDGTTEALDAIGNGLNERRSLTLIRARSNREAREHGLVINLANIVFAWVYTTDNASVETGQYI